MTIAVQCGSCRKRFAAKEKLAGRKMKCPQCGGVLTIPKPRPGPKAARQATEPPGDYAVAPPPAGETGSSTAGTAGGTGRAPDTEPKCPSCGASLKAGDVLCVQCGYDLRSGKKLEISGPDDREADPTASDAVSHAARSVGSYLLGCILSLVGMLIGAVVWYVVALIFGVELGWIAWGVGLLAGLGMLLGSRKENDLAGITAAFISIAGIFAAKWLIFASILAVGAEDLVAEEMMLEELPNGEAAPLTFWSLFGPFEGICILLAFFTAYGVGCGRLTWED